MHLNQVSGRDAKTEFVKKMLLDQKILNRLDVKVNQRVTNEIQAMANDVKFHTTCPHAPVTSLFDRAQKIKISRFERFSMYLIIELRRRNPKSKPIPKPWKPVKRQRVNSHFTH